VQRGATAIVSSAACGADLIGLSEAGKLGLRRRVVLPFSRRRFLETSVADCLGEWGKLYDAILDEVEAEGDLVILGKTDLDEAYLAANTAILDEATALGREWGESVVAALVWDGLSRGKSDYTAAFGHEARMRGLEVVEVRTI